MPCSRRWKIANSKKNGAVSRGTAQKSAKCPKIVDKMRSQTTSVCAVEHRSGHRGSAPHSWMRRCHRNDGEIDGRTELAQVPHHQSGRRCTNSAPPAESRAFYTIRMVSFFVQNGFVPAKKSIVGIYAVICNLPREFRFLVSHSISRGHLSTDDFQVERVLLIGLLPWLGHSPKDLLPYFKVIMKELRDSRTASS